MGARRGHGEGSITQRKDGRWEAKIDLGYVNGKRKRKSIYGKTRRDVAEKLKKVLRDQQQGLPVAYARQTVGQFLQDWLENTIKPTRRHKTYASYEQQIRLHLGPALGRIQLDKLTPQHVQSYINEKLASNLSPRTVQYHHATLRCALNYALRWGLVARNVATLVDPPSAPRKEVEPLNEVEARRFMKALEGHRLEALFSVALAVGLRLGEALGLLWEHVDLEAGEIRVVNQLQRVNGEWRLMPPKSKQSRRTIPLPRASVEALRAHRARQLEERLAGGSSWGGPFDLVFTSTVGTPLDDSNVRRQLRNVLDAAGLRHIRFHDLRHTCASLLLVQGVHARVVMETLGHSQISLTLDTYSHVLPVLQREAADRMDQLLRSAD